MFQPKQGKNGEEMIMKKYYQKRLSSE
jgi:hypothetical protein